MTALPGPIRCHTQSELRICGWRRDFARQARLAFVFSCNLGNVLDDTKRRRGAETAYREAIRLDPGLAIAHNNLGFLLKV